MLDQNSLSLFVQALSKFMNGVKGRFLIFIHKFPDLVVSLTFNNNPWVCIRFYLNTEPFHGTLSPLYYLLIVTNNRYGKVVLIVNIKRATLSIETDSLALECSLKGAIENEILRRSYVKSTPFWNQPNAI